MDHPPKPNSENDSKTLPKKELKKFTATLVDTTDLMKKQAIDVGNEKMTIEPESEELAKAGKWERLTKKEFWSRLGQKAWKYGVARDFYRNKEIYKASTEILKEQNVFIGEGRDKAANDKVMIDILDQFSSGYDDTIHTQAGEKKVVLSSENKEEKAKKDEIKKLVNDYATGKISQAYFKGQENGIIHDLKGKVDEEKIKGNTMYASNLFGIAEQLKLAKKNGEFLEGEDFEIDVIYGRSKASVRTEANYTKTEKIVKKILHTEVGQFVNESSLSIALSCASSLIARSAASLPGKILPIIGSAAISSWFANVRAKTEEEEKRKLHFRQIAKGETYNPNSRTPNRTEMDSFRYKTESATDLLKGMDANLKTLETSGASLTEQELRALLTEISSLEAKIQLSDRRNIDLITYSDTTKVVEERKNMDIRKRQLKDALQKIFNDRKIPIDNGQDFEGYYKSLANAEEGRLISEKDVGIDAKDRLFNKMKDQVGRKAAWKAFKNGVLMGTAMQELSVLWSPEKTGIIGDLVKGRDTLAPGVGTANLTGLAYLKHFFQGDIPRMSMGNVHEVLIGQNHMKLPQGVDMKINPDGSYNLVNGNTVLAENLKMNPDGSLSDTANNILVKNGIKIESHLQEGSIEKAVSPEDYIKNHPGSMKVIDRLGWYDNNTAKFDLGELKTHLGGINGTGINANGDYEIDVGKMMPGDSFHESMSADAQKLMKSGNLKMLFSSSKSTQGHGFEITVRPDGKIIIPKGGEAGLSLFENVNGKLQFNGRFGEVAEDMGNGKYMILSTMEGKGLSEIMDKVRTHTEETTLLIPGKYEGEMPPFITMVSGNPLEKMIKEEKKKQEQVKEGKIENQNNLKNVKEKENKVIIDNKKDLSVKEYTQKEYDQMIDDIKMINRKIQTSSGIITVSEEDFMSEHGKKRYMELKSIIKDVIPAQFNRTEMQTIGDEIEGLLSKAKIVSKKEKDKAVKKELEEKIKNQLIENNLRSDLEMLNKSIRESNGITTLDESDFKSEQGKEKYNELMHIQGKDITFNKDELLEIGNKLESDLINFQKKISSKEPKAVVNEVEPVKVATPEVNEPSPSSVTTPNPEVTKQYTIKDLVKVGTEFKSGVGTFKISKVNKGPLWGLFGKTTIEAIYTDNDGNESLVYFDKKGLEDRFEKQDIEITKTLENK